MPSSPVYGTATSEHSTRTPCSTPRSGDGACWPPSPEHGAKAGRHFGGQAGADGTRALEGPWPRHGHFPQSP
eukprot:CAMPEP_0170643754 /NCGR_PEP_ID=MMETSP0224-20130122/42076_1 /TAXON_ID=285029 /ORGANISM="Togula jolla, Strain CCCM 725" /LENGTH=71 /DNA_ID=CAMNT_0010974647 /DNA_START=50 /DNA_END=262 /DNA_ORIENTATION=-